MKYARQLSFRKPNRFDKKKRHTALSSAGLGAIVATVSALIAAAAAWLQVIATFEAVKSTERAKLASEYATVAYAACAEFVPPKLRDLVVNVNDLADDGTEHSPTYEFAEEPSISEAEAAKNYLENRPALLKALENASLKGRVLSFWKSDASEAERLRSFNGSILWRSNDLVLGSNAHGHAVDLKARQQREKETDAVIRNFLNR